MRKKSVHTLVCPRTLWTTMFFIFWFLPSTPKHFQCQQRCFWSHCSGSFRMQLFCRESQKNRSREAEKPQYQHTQQKCFPQFAAPRFFIWPHSEDKVRMQFQFGVCNRGCAELLVQRKSHSSPILALTRTHSQ